MHRWMFQHLQGSIFSAPPKESFTCSDHFFCLMVHEHGGFTAAHISVLTICRHKLLRGSVQPAWTLVNKMFNHVFETFITVLKAS